MTLTKHRDFSSDDYNGTHLGQQIWEEVVDWVTSCGLNEIYSEEQVAQWVHDNLDVEDVFDEDQLSKWAEENGYVKGEN